MRVFSLTFSIILTFLLESFIKAAEPVAPPAGGEGGDAGGAGGAGGAGTTGGGEPDKPEDKPEEKPDGDQGDGEKKDQVGGEGQYDGEKEKEKVKALTPTTFYSTKQIQLLSVGEVTEAKVAAGIGSLHFTEIFYYHRGKKEMVEVVDMSDPEIIVLLAIGMGLGKVLLSVGTNKTWSASTAEVLVPIDDKKSGETKPVLPDENPKPKPGLPDENPKPNPKEKEKSGKGDKKGPSGKPAAGGKPQGPATQKAKESKKAK